MLEQLLKRRHKKYAPKGKGALVIVSNKAPLGQNKT